MGKNKHRFSDDIMSYVLKLSGIEPDMGEEQTYYLLNVFHDNFFLHSVPQKDYSRIGELKFVQKLFTRFYKDIARVFIEEHSDNLYEYDFNGLVWDELDPFCTMANNQKIALDQTFYSVAEYLMGVVDTKRNWRVILKKLLGEDNGKQFK